MEIIGSVYLLLSWCYFLVKYCFYGIAIYVLYQIIKLCLLEITYYLAVRKHYNTPGVYAYYKPFVGLFPKFLKKDPKDPLKTIVDWNQKQSESGNKMFLSNFLFCSPGSYFVQLLSAQSIKDFMKYDFNCTEKQLGTSTEETINLGFLTKNGPDALRVRSIFTDFFIYDNLKALYKPMYDLMVKRSSLQIEQYGINKNEFTKVDMREYLKNYMREWIALLLFGFDSTAKLDIDLSKYPEVRDGEYGIKSLKGEKVMN